ncbi:MAG: hypothetical protein KME08_20240 [Aphanothece sp. CMT-3BRIN-NPC111]|jgi:hypothetical protein|nr:hypothetical protein [Aphanothece sp. CMT-3BRIN-NPC111]
MENSSDAQITQPPAPTYNYLSPEYSTREYGNHSDGTYIKVYIPQNPYAGAPGKYRAIVYLHGFSLGIPRFYEDHLEHLVKQGYFVFFPDYQKDLYDNDDIYQRDIDSLVGDVNSPFLPSSIVDYLRKWIEQTFNRNRDDAEDILKLIAAVWMSLDSSPEQWLNGAIFSTQSAVSQVQSLTGISLSTQADVYLFGHSLGGLFALSWCHFLAPNQSWLQPKQVIVADPVPDSLSNQPAFVKLLLETFFRHKPFVRDPMNIRDTGASLHVPVGILYGAEDTISPPISWQKVPPLKRRSAYDCIASQQKQIYFSHTDAYGQPPLDANHNQSVTDTTYLPNSLADQLGGAKIALDDFHYRYIWFALDKVIDGTHRADQLYTSFKLENWSDGKPVAPITYSWPAHSQLLADLAASYSAV